ncbi:hypothetical protein CHO01_21770 [Cellulomonas hominis]|uniref:Uncharacterized protein n=1 Tax=Cellulomonas hominis TaxID=156981 RepID=A0A511FCU4_9CELL|nr:hypothetical protein [Cellulomonas hominis]MBB5474700.1 hypothetical protein [Cellulomonas hominis]NKY05765.1 hypothetical protein [Cellulomonas hominis]GEL47061.1 hypothetical protein CHO01_21770 [Cellulomonas hominis]
MSIFEQILQAHGYGDITDGGMVEGTRPDGSKLGLFRWGNTKHAEADLIPRAYLVVVLTHSGRFRLPTVVWEPWLPVTDQTPRPSAEVRAEFDEVFGPALDMPVEQAVQHLSAAGPRYDMDWGLRKALKEAGLTYLGFHSRNTPVWSPSRAEYRVYGEGGELVVRRDTAERRVTLAGMAFDDVVDWLRRTAV